MLRPACWRHGAPSSSTRRSRGTALLSCLAADWGRLSTTQARSMSPSAKSCLTSGCLAVLGIPRATVMVQRAGMSWSGFRPSDDQNTYGYNVPGNMYAAASLERVLQLNAAIWRDDEFEEQAAKLLRSIRCNTSSVTAIRPVCHLLLHHSADIQLACHLQDWARRLRYSPGRRRADTLCIRGGRPRWAVDRL